ncbi:MAG: ATP-binding protein, partial [Anaerolineaceae bacterium]|nr:ATP-binding protein [Anaerolineaceae bacterium]
LEESILRATQLDQRSQRLALLNQFSGDLSTSLEVDDILKLSAELFLSALSVSTVAAVLISDDHNYVLTKEMPASEEKLPRLLPDNAMLNHLSQSLGVFSTPDIMDVPELASLLQVYFTPRNICSLLIIPLDTAVKLHGWFWLSMEASHRFSPSEIELACTIGNQAAIAIQNASLFEETHQLVDELETRVRERTAELEEEHRTTQTLLKISNELSTGLEIDNILERTLSILNDTYGAEQALILLADGTSRMFSAGLSLVQPLEGFDFFSRTRPEREISGWVLLNRTSTLIENLITDSRWDFTDVDEITFRSVYAIPLIIGDQILGSLQLLHRKEGFFDVEKMGLAEATSRQISIALNNAELLDLARDQSDRLIDMLRDQQIDSSRSYAILEAVADGVLVTDATNTVTLFNISAERILKLAASDVVGQSLNNFMDMFELSAKSWMQTIERWSQDIHLYQGETYAEQLELDDGSIILIHLAPVILGSNFLGTVTIFRDITPEVVVDRLKSDFVANVSHELRTPLTSIKGYAEIMLMGASGSLSDQQEQFMETIKSNSERLSVLVDDLLNISYIEAGQIALAVKPIDLLKIAEGVLQGITKRSEEDRKLMDFDLEALSDLPVVYGDPEKVRNILMNLVNNAYNYTPENGRVVVHILLKENEVQIDVQDNGIGIEPEQHSRIFERFYRGENALVIASAGTGLGLAISKVLVEMHNGRIWFESSGVAGEGSIFSFTLPLLRKEE